MKQKGVKSVFKLQKNEIICMVKAQNTQMNQGEQVDDQREEKGVLRVLKEWMK